MTVRFVLGRAGSGKTRHCLHSIADHLRRGPEGPPLVCLVPEQATFQMERALLEAIGGRAFTRARVLSFRRLAHWVFSEAGGPESPPIGELQRRLLLRLILRRRLPELEVFGRSAGQAGFEDELARLVAEFLRQRITPDGLRAVSLALDEGAGAGIAAEGGTGSPRAWLGAKLRDLALLFDDYLKEIRGRFSNPEEAPDHLARSLQRAPLLRGALVWVDGFASFSAQELFALGEILAQAEHAEVCLCLDSEVAGVGGEARVTKEDGGGEGAGVSRSGKAAGGGGSGSSVGDNAMSGDDLLFAETRRTYQRLRELIAAKGLAMGEAVGLFTNGRAPRFAAAPDLAHLESEFARPFPSGWPGPAPSIHLAEASSPRAEAEAAARELLRLRREAGLRWRDMAVLCRSLDACLPDLLPALRRHGIPFFLDRRRSLDSHPLVTALVAAVRTAFLGWPSTDVIGFLKSGLAPLEPEAVDRLENYVLEHGMSGRRHWVDAPTWTAWPRRRLDEEEAWEKGEEDREREETLARINGWRARATAFLTGWSEAHFGPEPEKAGTGAGRGLDGDAKGTKSAGEKKDASGSENSSNLGTTTDFSGEGGGVAAEVEAGGVPGRALALALADLLRRLDAAGRMEAWERRARARGELARAEEHRQALDTILGALAEMASVLDRERLNAREAVEVAEAALGGLEIGIIPAGLDEVLLGSVDRSRQPDLRAALVLGFAEGLFPSVRAQDPLLTDPEREALRSHGCEVAPPAAETFLNEYYFAYIACTRASERLWVSRPLANDRGEELPPSPFWKQIRRLFPTASLEEIRPSEYDWSAVSTPLDWLSHYARRRNARAAGADLPDSLLERRIASLLSPAVDSIPGDSFPGHFSSSSFCLSGCDAADPTHSVAADPADPLRRLRQFAACVLAGPAATGEATLDPALSEAALLRDDALSVSLSQVESFTRCPYKHFASYVLRLEERPEFRIELVDLGSLYHAVLNLWIGEAIRDGVDLAASTDDDIQRAIRGITDVVAPRLKNELLLSNARFRYIVDLVKDTLVRLARTIVDSLARGAFRPFAVEAGFGNCRGDFRPLEIDLPGGRRMRFRGRIDRVDAAGAAGAAGATEAARAADSCEAGVCVIDYKMSERTLDLAKVLHGLDLQLGGYLLALRDSAGASKRLGGAPAAVGAFYMPVLESAARYDHPDDLAAESSEDHHRRRKMRGLFDAAWLNRIEPLEAGGKGVFHHVSLNKAGGIITTRSDALARDELELVLTHISRVLRRTGVAMLSGRIEVAPAEYGSETPCGFCAFKPVCRVDPVLTPARALPKLGGRAAALAAMAGGAPDGD